LPSLERGQNDLDQAFAKNKYIQNEKKEHFKNNFRKSCPVRFAKRGRVALRTEMTKQ
jgi:hypothetical protein